MAKKETSGGAVNMHKKMAMGEKVTGMKAGGKVDCMKKGGAVKMKAEESSFKKGGKVSKKKGK